MSVFCVNRSHEDFKKLSKELDIHEDQLNDIIYKYENDNQVDAFPSKEYIENVLRGDNPITSLDQYGIWLNKYSEPKVFDSKEEANSYIEEAKRFFPAKEAIVTKRKANGQVEVIVGRPYDKNDITSLLMHHLNTYEGIEVGNSTELGNYLQENGYTNILEAIEAEKEMLAIKAEAIADGTFMKAPNGKKSNLNERLWLQVRTKAFKRWFGDWLKGLSVNQDNDSFYRGQFDKPYIDSNGNLILYGRKDPLYEKAGYENKGVSVTRNLESAIEYGEGQFETRANLVMDNSMDEAEQNAVLSNGYYIIQFKDSVSNREIKEAGESKLIGDITVPKGSYVIEHYVQGELIETIGNINNPNASKVVDENGEPLVVYHHTNNNFEAFNTEKQTYNEFYFTTSASEKNIYYPNNAHRKFHLPVFLNIRVLEYANGTESEVSLYKSEELYKQLEEAIKEANNLYKIRNELAKKKAPVDEIREITKKAKDAAKKAELIEEEAIVEFGKVSNNPTDSRFYFPNAPTVSALGVKRGWADGESFYIVFKPNQIKSATANSGEFSPFNTDIQMFIGKKARTKFAAKEHGVTIQTEALNITGNKFKNSLYRGQGYAPVIDAEGNLHLHTNYDSLSKLKTLSFDSTIEGAEHYGNRSARHPYIIEIDEDFLDTILPKEDYDRDKVNRGESFRYNEEFNEVRLSFKDELIIPKGKFNITQTNETLRLEDFDDIMSSIGWLQSLEERSEIEEYNGASELIGRIHENDLKSLGKALKNTLGTYKGYDVITILYDVLALQNDVPGSPIGPSSQYKEFINKGLIETEDLNGYTYYRPSKALIEHLTKKLGLRKTSKTSQSIFPQNPSTPSTPPTPFAHFAPSNDYGDLPFFRTPQGEIYGFVGKDNKIYLDERIISPEHPIHEYTHLWDRVVAKINPKLWKRGVELMKKTSLWKLYANDPNYGLKWKATEGMTTERFEELVASEVHARLVGKEGEELLTQLAKEKGSKNIIEKLKSWLLDVWRELKSTFSNWSQEDINKLTLEDFNNMTLRDFVNKVSLDTNNLLRSLNEEYYAEREDFNKQLGEENTRTDTEKALNNWFEWGKEHIKFDEDSHIYYINGKPVDFSVTEYYESVYGKPNIKGDYSHSLAIGKTMDSFYRDYFKGEDVLSKDYPNLNLKRKKEALVDVRRLESYLDKKFGVDDSGNRKYKVITTEFPLAAKINTSIGEQTIAGTMDMLVIDSEGNLHIFDFKAKTNTIDEWNNRRNYTAQLNLYRAILESINPAFKGKVKSLSLIWLSTYYPGIRNANYTTFKNGSVIVSDGTNNNIPLSEYKHFMTPKLSEEENKAIIKLDIKEDIQEIKPSSVSPLILEQQQQQSLPGPETKINIYAGTNENADLSNFATRPFTFQGRDFTSVELAFLIAKLEALKAQLVFFGSAPAKTAASKIDNLLEALKNSSTGAEAKKLGDTIITSRSLDVKDIIDMFFAKGGAWDKLSLKAMKMLIKASFEQNTQALQRLLATGNATLTHTQDKGKWGTEFPRLLMEVREELRGQYQQNIQQEKQKIATLEKDLGGGERTETEIIDTVRVAKKGLSFEEALKGQESFFSKEEQNQIKQGLNGRNLQVMSVSRLTDPAFFSKEIISFLEKNAEKPLNDPTRITAIEIWSKHDGLPIKDILDACKKYRVAPMVSFSITGLGGTALEGGVMKYQDMLEKVGELIKNGTLNPTTTTIRIDPILPGVTNMDDIRKIVETAKSYGIKKFVTSLMQSYGSTENRVSVYNSASKYRYDYYTISNPKDVEKLKVRFPELDITGVKKEKDGSLVLIDSHGNKIESTKFNYDDRKVVLGINNALASEGKTYDWDKYYGRQPWDGKIAFKPKQEVIDEIGKILLELDKDPEITIQTCSFGINGLKVSACLDPMIIERITGVDVLRKDGTYDRDTSRPECMCYGCHGDFFKGQNKKCFSSCAYCYAAHSGDNKLNYYNEDGTLKDNDYTRTEASVSQILLLVKPIQTLQELNIQAIETLKTTEEQVKPKQEQTKATSNQTLSKEAQKHINRCLVYKKQVEELSKSFKKSEIQTLSTSIANRVSSIISEIEENPNLIKDYFNLERSELSGTPTREEIINKIGIDNLYKAIANKYFRNVTSFSKKGKVVKIQRNFQILMLLSNPILSKNEGIQVDFNFTKKDVEEILDSFNENDEANENNATSQESWQNNIRTVSVENMMLPKIRRLLSNLPLIKNGELIKDEWGIPQTVSLREAIGTILNAIGGKAKDHKKMASLLTLYIEDSKNTWLQPIVDILNDTTGKYETELSLLFKDFCKNSLKFSVSGKDFISHIIDSKLDYAFSRVKQTFGSKLWLILNKTDDKVNKEGLNKLVELATVDKLKTKEGIKQLYEAFGIYLSNLDAERIVSLGREESLVTTIRSIYAVLKEVNEEFTPFDRNSDSGISSYLHTLLEPYVKITSEGFTSTVVSEGKRYQLFVLPSFLSKFNSIIQNSSEEELVNWMMNTYGNVEWYKLSDTNDEDVLGSVADGWRNPILLLLATDPNFRKNFDWTQSLGYREEKLYQFMRTMSPLQCFKMQLNMFNATDGRKGDIIPAWYAVPLMANKPSAEFIKLNRYRGDNYKATILGLLAPMFIKEIYRIKLVRERKNYIKEHPEKEILNFDKRGDKFCNFEMFNDVSESSRKTIEDFIEDKVSVEELSNMFNSEMTKYLDSRVTTNSMLLGVQDTALENFYWNNFLAKMSMEDLFLGDSAFYKNVVDKVKRALQLHSSGQRPNTSATWNKKPVSDGKHRAIVLSSFKEIKSNIISNLKEVFAKRAALFTGEDRNAFEAYADSIIKLYEEVDVTDGQAYTTISGYRKKAIMFGKWSREAEEVYNRLKNGEVNLSVLKQAFPPLKPFQYSQTKTDLSNNGQIVSNVSSTLVPSQYKTAEYLLIMADALLLGNKENKENNILKAITDIIEDTHNGEGDDYKKGIDTVLFDSSVKEGNSAVIDISTLIKEGKTAEEIKNEINDKISRYKQDANNPYVKVTPFEDYMILQELPPHFKDHYQSFPTLARYLAITDLLSNFNGEEVLFTIGDKSYTVKELQQEWEKVWKEEVDYGTDKLLKELAINSGNKAERNVRLSKLLVNSLLDSSKMNMETFESILVDENGEFQMPIDDPALATTVMPLIFSAVKSRVNKQTAAGGPIVQVSSFGTSKKLNIRFKDKSGKLLLTREGWENSKNKSHESYDDYIKENQAGVAYMEVYASVPSEEIFNTFRDKKGNIDINAINRVNPGLLEMIGVRIPTEGKLSMWPMKIVGFLPYEAGEAIMLPEEITKITGSDFDSDKQYIIRKALSIVERTADNKKEKVINYLLEQNKNYTREFVEKAYDEYMENPENYKDAEDVHWEVENALSKSHIKYAARATKEHNKRRNHIFDMMMAVLLHESVADQLLTPQGFDLLKVLAAEINGVSDFSELQNDPTNLTDLATYLNYYNLNKEGGLMLGIFASQKIAHAVLSMDNYHLLISGLEKTPFKLGGLVYKGLIAIDPLYNKEGTLIGEILGSCVGASADVTKDPVLPYLGINSYNINVFITGVRLGIPLKPLILLLNHPALKALYAEKSNGETKSLKPLVSQALNTKLEKAGFEKEGRNSEMFMSKDALETDLTALNAFLTLIYCSETVDSLSKKTRLNSTTDSATVGPYFGDFLYKDKVLSNQVPEIYDEEGNFVDANDTFYKNHPMLEALYNAFPIIKKIFKDTSLGSLLNTILEEGLRTTGVDILKNQGLATKFIKFYLSLLLFYLNLSDPNKGISIKKVADGYYDTFAKNFNKIKESYKDNQLIKTIKIETDNKGEATLLIPNLDDLGREEVNALRAAWEDLAVDAPEVARDLFEWNAVKGGLTFNPNTFVHLAGNNVRSLIPGYKEAFAGNADFNISRIYDDFIVKYWRQLMLPRLTPKIIAEKSYKYVTDGEYLYKLNDSGEYRVVNTNIPVYQQLSELMDESKSESQEGAEYRDDIYRLEDREITDNAIALDALKKSDETDTDDYLKLNEEAGLHIPLTKEEKNNIIEDLKGYCTVNKKP